MKRSVEVSSFPFSRTILYVGALVVSIKSG